jgi:hypothetical protein
MEQQYFRFRDLQRLGIFANRMGPRRAIARGDLKPPVMLGPNTIAWPGRDIAEYLNSRPRRMPGRGAQVGNGKRWPKKFS